MANHGTGAPKQGAVVSKETFTFPHTAFSISGTVAAAAGNLMQPMLPMVWISVLGFAGVWAGALLMRRRSDAAYLKGISSFAAMGALISVFLLAAQFIPRSSESRELVEEVGVIAASVPGAVSVQNAVLPLSKEEKQTNSFRSAIARGDEVDRGLAARSLIEAQEEPSMATALVDIALRSDVASVRQAGLAKALRDRLGAFLPLKVEGGADAPTALALLGGAQFALRSVDADTGVVRGVFQCAGDAGRALDGVIASGGLAFTTKCFSRAERRWVTIRVELQPKTGSGMAGEAMADAETLAVSAPLL